MTEVPLNIRFAEKAARLLGYDTDVIDTFSHYLIRISSGSRLTFVGGGSVHSYPINTATGATLSKDKTHTHALLARLGMPVPESQLVFLSDRYADMRPPGREIAEAKAFAAALGYPVFVKPNEGSRGVFAQSVQDEAALERHLDTIAQRFLTAVVQEFLRGEEHRLFYIDGVPLYAYTKTRPVMIADGARSIEMLLRDVDRKAHRAGLAPANRSDPVLGAFLADRAMTLDSIASAGLQIPYSEAANVSRGGGVADFRECFTPAETELCAFVHRQTGIRVCAIDVIDSPRGRIILELNANPALTSLEAMGKTELLTAIWMSVLKKAIEP